MLHPNAEFNYEDEKWIKSNKNGTFSFVETNWANDSIWPGYWKSHAAFPISYDYMTLYGYRASLVRGSQPCPNMSQTTENENKMFFFRPYSSRTCHLRSGFSINLNNQQCYCLKTRNPDPVMY